jgi:hypothetical protein
MYISRLLFHAIPGKTGEVEKQLAKLQQMVQSSDRASCRILHTLPPGVRTRPLSRKRQI